MAWIKIINEADAEGELRERYERLREPWGGVDNILKIHSLNLPSLDAHLALYRTLMYGPSDLSRSEREMIALVASAINHCVY